MTNLIVIRIVPQSPVAAGDFTGYLGYQGGLQITAYDLSFNSPTSGQSVGTAAYLQLVKPPSPLKSEVNSSRPQKDPQKDPQYNKNTGIAQQVNHIPAQQDPDDTFLTKSAYYQFESVATAVIEIPSSTTDPTFENLRLVASWGSGANAVAIPTSSEYYNVALIPGPKPDPNQWSSLQPSLYFSLPALTPTLLPSRCRTMAHRLRTRRC